MWTDYKRQNLIQCINRFQLMIDYEIQPIPHHYFVMPPLKKGLSDYFTLVCLSIFCMIFFYFYPLVSTCCMSLMSWWALLIFRSVGQKSSLFSYVEEGGISILQTSLVNVVTVLLRIWELLFVFVSPRFLESRRAWTHLSVPPLVSLSVCHKSFNLGNFF